MKKDFDIFSKKRKRKKLRLNLLNNSDQPFVDDKTHTLC